MGSSRFGRRALATMVATAALVAGWAVPRLTAALAVRSPLHPKILFLGDSVMDQQGKSAALLLRQVGFDAQAHAAWGTGLLTRAQYDFGHTITSQPTNKNEFDWLVQGRAYVDAMHPDLVVVYLDHNYWPPYPRDARGQEILDLRSRAAQQMIATQARAFIDILRSRGARVAFVTPVPETFTDPATDNAIWAAYLPVLREAHIDVIDIRPALVGPNGTRTEAETDCRGQSSLVRPPNNLHLTRFGAGRAATLLASAAAGMFGRTLYGMNAPGDHTATVVPTTSGHGYWLVACDGGVYAFGDAQPIVSAPAPTGNPLRSDPVIGAARATGRGLWLVTRHGQILRRGGAPALTFASSTPAPLVSATGTPGGTGLIAVSATGAVITAGTATWAGNATGLRSPVVAVAVQPSGTGYWMLTADGAVLAFGAARARGPERDRSGSPAVAIASSATGNGYEIVHADGHVLAFGDARGAGDAPAPAPVPTARSVAIVGAAPGGYWIVDDNGMVYAFGGAPTLGGTGNLARFAI